MNRSLRFFYHWTPWALISLVLPGLVYVVVQQDIRQSANDPQIQMAEDAAAKLRSGDSPQTVAASQPVDIAHSLAPAMIVYDQSGKVLASSAELNGHNPALPDGVLNDVKNGNQQIAVMGPTHPGELRFTWEPQPGVRMATVITSYKGGHSGFVLAARNMREVEGRESSIFILTAVVSLVLLAVTAAWSLMAVWRHS